MHAALAEDRLDEDGGTVPSTAALRASTSPQATWRNPSGIGWNGSCLLGWPVAARAARVRPWKLPEGADHRVRPPAAVLAGQLDRALDRLGAAVGEEHPSRVAGGVGQQFVDGDRRRGACGLAK